MDGARLALELVVSLIIGAVGVIILLSLYTIDSEAMNRLLPVIAALNQIEDLETYLGIFIAVILIVFGLLALYFRGGSDGI